jgi:predicted phage terminase large subunit-like protein
MALAMEMDWASRARLNQLPPRGDWTTWLVLAGRGWGKTRTGAEWVRDQVENRRAGRIALVGPTAADTRDVMIEGESGLRAISAPWCRPEWEPSKRRVTWPNGAIATTYSADEPDRLRGPQHDLAWSDELGAWRYPDDCWAMLMLGLRLGTHPRCLVTTTPKPTKLIKDLISRVGRDVALSRGATYENAVNLAKPFLDTIISKYEGTRLGRQELNAEVLEDVPGALWQRAWFDRDRVSKAPELRRIVVAIDPAAKSTEGSDETGIVAAGITRDNNVYVLEDSSGRYAPETWARTAIDAYRRHQADCIVAEVNNGGEMCGHTIRMVDPLVSFHAVHASRGKVVRAEPVSTLYEQAKVHHVGSFPELEDQLAGFTSDFDRARAGYSPDRLDALVWAVSELAVQEQPAPPMFGTYGRFGNDRAGRINGMSPETAIQLGFLSRERALRQGLIRQ